VHDINREKMPQDEFAAFFFDSFDKELPPPGSALFPA
jgi:hypothetical protein